jgi:hypothetical protein
MEQSPYQKVIQSISAKICHQDSDQRKSVEHPPVAEFAVEFLKQFLTAESKDGINHIREDAPSPYCRHSNRFKSPSGNHISHSG